MIICNRVAMSWSPVVARRTLSHVRAMVCSAEVAEDANWLSLVVEQDLGGCSSLRRPARKECPAVLAGRGVGVSDAAAMSSGSTNISGDVDPVGCLERASAALCRTPGMWIIRNW